MAGILLTNCPIVLRIVIGPFHKSAVVFVSYLYHIVIIFCINLLTFKTVLASAFIVNFDKMSGEKERKKKYLYISSQNTQTAEFSQPSFSFP